MGKRTKKVVGWYVGFLLRHPLGVLLGALVATGLAAVSASGFTLKTDFVELLPRDEPSVRDLERAKQRKGGLSSMHVVVMGDDAAANRRFVDDLAARFELLPEDLLVFLKHDFRDEKAFYERHGQLYADLDDLEAVHERLRRKIRYERIRNNPVLGMDFDGDEPEPVEFDLADIREKYERSTAGFAKYLDGYFSGEDGRLYAMLLYPPGASTGVDFGKRMLKEVKSAAAEVCLDGPAPAGADLDRILREACKRRYHPSTRIGFSGGIVTAVEEQAALVADLLLVTCICLSLVSLVVLVYFRLWRSLPVVVVPLLMGTTWTFGLSIFIVDHLNTTTAFLAAIIVGNGINFGLIQLARWIEERRRGLDLQEALRNALGFTAKATSTAALAASIAYGSLIVTEFRGFSGFGYMGGIGMVTCWLSAFTVQPALLILWERLRPVRIAPRRRTPLAERIAGPFSRLLTRHGGWMHAGVWALAAVCVVASIAYLRDPFEYDFRNLRNQTAATTGSGALNKRVDAIFDRRLDPLFVLADRPDQVPLIREALERNNAVGPHRGIFQEIRTIHTYLPSDQEKKVRVLRKIRRLLTDSTLSWLSDEERADVEKFKPQGDLRPLTLADLPDGITRVFTELDGRVGLPVALYMRSDVNHWDGRFLMRVADAARSIALPDGERVTSAGVAMIFADMVRAVTRDGPRAVLVSLVGVLLLVLAAYRGHRFAIFTLVSLFFSVLWTVGPAAMLGIKLNFLNFIALPITFGIGIDYAVNILNRYRSEGSGATRRVLAHTGGAVVLCSLTTLIGYASLLIADNRALVSFGSLSILGEVASLGAAVFLLPILVSVAERSVRRRVRSTGTGRSPRPAPRRSG